MRALCNNYYIFSCKYKRRQWFITRQEIIRRQRSICSHQQQATRVVVHKPEQPAPPNESRAALRQARLAAGSNHWPSETTGIIS